MIPLVAPSYSQSDREAVWAAATRLDDDFPCRRLEERLAAMYGAEGAVLTGSGTAALHLALCAIPHPSDGREEWVEFPTFSCVALLNATRWAFMGEDLSDCLYVPEKMQYGAKDFYDGSDTVEIVPHMFGVITPMRDLTSLVIEDWAMAIGATPAVIRGQCAVFSFHSSKIVSGQHGGAVVTNDHDLLARLRDLNSYEAAVVADRLNPNPTYVQRMNSQMSPLNAALVLSQLDRLPEFIDRRRRIAHWYNDAIAGCPAILPTKVPEGSVFGRYVMALTKHHPADVIMRLSKYGIEAGRGVYPPLHRYLGLNPKDFPNAEKAMETVLSLPCYPALSDADVENIAEATKEVLTSPH